jgi:hypothetical protein
MYKLCRKEFSRLLHEPIQSFCFSQSFPTFEASKPVTSVLNDIVSMVSNLSISKSHAHHQAHCWGFEYSLDMERIFVTP